MYLYVFEDQCQRQSELPPTKGDLNCIADGTLDVIVFETGRFWALDENGNKVAIGAAKRESFDMHTGKSEYTVP